MDLIGMHDRNASWWLMKSRGTRSVYVRLIYMKTEWVSAKDRQRDRVGMYNVVIQKLIIVCVPIGWIENLLSGLRKRHADERWTQCFCIHFHAGAAQILIRPNLHVRWLNNIDFHKYDTIFFVNWITIEITKNNGMEFGNKIKNKFGEKWKEKDVCVYIFVH